MAAPPSSSDNQQPPADQTPADAGHQSRQNDEEDTFNPWYADLAERQVEERDQNEFAAERLYKCNKYIALYSRRLKSKYFSMKAFDGGDIYENEDNFDGQTIRSSRWPCMRSFADPVQYIEDKSKLQSPVTETSSAPTKKSISRK